MNTFTPTEKQKIAFYYLTDKVTKFIGFGGGAGGGKSFLGCLWQFYLSVNYPNHRGALARKELINLKKTTLLSFFKIISNKECGLGLNPSDYFKLNSQTNTIEFKNGSKIFLLDLAYKPSDPDYLRLGGLELDDAFVDESNECPQQAIIILSSRIGRGTTGLPPKMLETFNPSKNFIYQKYYLPYKERNLPINKVFIPSLATDNNYLTEEYIEMLKTLPENQKQRLLYGNFDYDNDPSSLVDYDAIQDIFSNEFVENTGVKYLSSDIAMRGRDNFVIFQWNGLRAKIPVIKQKTSGPEVVKEIKRISIEYNVPRSHIIVDTDGLGGFLESFTDDTGVEHEGFLKNIKSFHAGSSAMKDKEFVNLKSECAFKLAEMINLRKIYIECNNEIKEKIIEELSQLKQDHLDKDEQRKAIIKKDKMKENIGRSPDFLDCLIFRMYFELRGNTNFMIC
jgi:hypothetical protein